MIYGDRWVSAIVFLIEDDVLLPGSLCQSSTGREEGTKTGGELLSLLLHHCRGKKKYIPGNLLLPADMLSTPASLPPLYLTGRPGETLFCGPRARFVEDGQERREAAKRTSKTNTEGRDGEGRGSQCFHSR